MTGPATPADAPAAALRLFDDSRAADAAAFAEALDLNRQGAPVAPGLEAAASRHMLRETPDDGPRWLRLWQLTRDQATPEVGRALLRAALADARQDAAWRGAVARALLAGGEVIRGTTGLALARLAAADGPDEGTLAGLLSHQPAAQQGRLALAMLEALPESAILAYYAARRLYDAGRRDCAIDVLQRLGGVEHAHAYTARLLIDMLVHAGRLDEARTAVARHFAHGPSTIWCPADLHPRRLAARARGVPPIVIATQPKSGSVFMLNTLCEGLGCPNIIVQPLEHLDEFGPTPERLAELAEGGVVCVDHLFASQETLEALVAAGLDRLVVHLRDPRAATLSWCHNLVDAPYVALPRRERIRRRVGRTQATFERDYLAWLPYWCGFQEAWLERLETGFGGLALMRTDFEELADEDAFFARLLGFFRCPSGLFDATVLTRSRETRAGHFRKGLRREWETALSASTRALQEEIIARFPRVAAYVAEIDARAA